jgi:predicted DNA-binding protein (UPF0251 family)
MGKDKDAEKWFKKHAHELPPEEPPRERIGGKQIKFTPISLKMPAPEEKTLSEESQRRFYESDNLGEKYDDFVNAVEQSIFRREYALTPREFEILELLRSGLSQADIGRRLKISRPAVTKCCERIRKVMGRHVENLFEPKSCTGVGLLQAQAKAQDLRPRARKKERSG